VVSAVTVGAFTFTAGADAEVGGSATVLGAGGGAKSSSKRETLSSDGSEGACDKATLGDRAPPDECGALIRLEVVPLVPSKAFAGRWLCTSSGTITAPQDGSTAPLTGTLAETFTDNGDGTLVSEGLLPDGHVCSHKYIVTGTTATLAGPSTCRSARAVSTRTSANLSVTGGILTVAFSGTELVDEKLGVTFTGTSTCTKLSP
jgi:hypothetical protein